MLTKHNGNAMLEWIIMGALLVAVAGAAIYGVIQSISTKMQQINVQIGS